jgi:hypothetical protein
MAGERKDHCGETGHLYAISPNGEIKWKKTLESPRDYDFCHPASIAIGEDGTVYIGTWFGSEWGDWGYLYAFGPGEPNHPPSKPSIEGPESGRVGIEYNYTFVAIDPEEYL